MYKNSYILVGIFLIVCLYGLVSSSLCFHDFCTFRVCFIFFKVIVCFAVFVHVREGYFE